MRARSCCSKILLLALFALPCPAAAQPKIDSGSDATETLRLEVGETRLIRMTEKIVRISVADPEVADVRVVTPLQVLVTAKAVGFTHMIMWGETDRPLVTAISCTRNLDQLRTQLKELFVGEAIKVSSAGELVVLSGKVSDVRLPARAAEVAQLHSKKVANLIEVRGDQQVQLDVSFAEVSRSGARRMGLNFLWRDGARGFIGGASPAGTPAGNFLSVPGTGGAGGPPSVPIPTVGNAFNLFFSTGLSQFPFSAILSILAEEGLAKVLAEPTLVALSGQEAKFHAGGEVPVLVSQQLGTVSVEYKKFGVKLNFVPTVLGNRTVSLKIYAEVSELDDSSGVTLGGFRIPGFRTRSSETSVRLKDGQSFAVAGLLSDSTRSTVQKVPLLGDIPLLGALFRSTAFQRDETELLVVVRTHLVQPLKPGEAPLLPGEDEINHPDDFQLFLLGQIEGFKKRRKQPRPARQKTGERPARSVSGGPVGPIGFVRF